MNGRRAKERRRLAGYPDAVKHVSTDRALRSWDGKPAKRMGTIVGWCATKADLYEARRRLHDALIELMGTQRTGGVSWIHREGQAAYDKLSELTDGETSQEHLDNYRRVRAHLREYGGLLVIAMAPGEMSNDPEGGRPPRSRSGSISSEEDATPPASSSDVSQNTDHEESKA